MKLLEIKNKASAGAGHARLQLNDRDSDELKLNGRGFKYRARWVSVSAVLKFQYRNFVRLDFSVKSGDVLEASESVYWKLQGAS